MTHRVVLSSTAVHQFRRLTADGQTRLRKGFEALVADPLTPRSGADIKRLAGTNPAKHRLRVGDYRVVYTVHEGLVQVVEIFTRGRGYRFD